MAKPLQIRDVPEPVHDALRANARRAGMSLSAYALRVLERDARQPSLEEVFARVERRSGSRVTPRSVADALEVEREDAR